MEAVAVMLVLAWAAGVCGASTITVGCIGTESGGWGGPLGWRYAYEVTVVDTPGDLGMWYFQVGTCDLTLANYSRVMITDMLGNPIPGWQTVYPGGTANPHDIEAHRDGKTPHGTVSQGPLGIAQGYVRWDIIPGTPTIPDGTTVFCGFDNPNTSHDVGWTAGIPGMTDVNEDWSQGVGFGYGPVHGPVPEPATLLLMGAGLTGLLARRRGR
jgi:hypothetical protein